MTSAFEQRGTIINEAYIDQRIREILKRKLDKLEKKYHQIKDTATLDELKAIDEELDAFKKIFCEKD